MQHGGKEARMAKVGQDLMASCMMGDQQGPGNSMKEGYYDGRGKMGSAEKMEWSGMSWSNQAKGGSFSFLNSRGVSR